MQVFLASIPLQGRTVVVIGGGEPAVAKARLAARTPARLLWLAPDGAPDPAERPRGVAAPLERAAQPEDFSGAALVFIALAEEAQVSATAALARAAGALVNVVDRPALSDFQTPALVDRGEVVVGVATGGSAPILARDIRARIEAVLPPGLGALARIAGEVRDTVKVMVPDFLDRRRFWERAFRGRGAELAARGDESGARREILRELNTPVVERGVVHLVGAGPGDPELLTVKAVRILRDADVVVYDRLVSDGVLDYARRDARRIYVGKSKGEHSVPQERIEEILIEEARAGLRVVRLKGGDPFVFGRGGEELEALHRAGVEVHVVPGVTAALGCAASAQLPLTHRDHAQAVTFVTGQPKKDGPDLDWSALASAHHTLAVYMGVGAAPALAQQLLGAGRSPATPVAVVENGTLPGERVLGGTLGELPSLITREGVDGPAILYIGATAGLAAVSAVRESAA